MDKITELENKITKFLDKEKAENIKIIDLKGKADFADKMIIASSMSNKHSAALADKMADELEKFGCFNFHTEGTQTGDWVLIDTLDIVIHIFAPDFRDHYNLEKMWRN